MQGAFSLQPSASSVQCSANYNAYIKKNCYFACAVSCFSSFRHTVHHLHET